MSKTTEDEMVEVHLDNAGYSCPPNTGKIALIDADTVIFASCSVLAFREHLMPRENYTDEEWACVIAEPGYVEEHNIVEGIDLEEAYEHSLDKITSIMERTGCDRFEIHFTVGRDSFPYQVFPDYKVNRTVSNEVEDRPPYGIRELKDLFCERHPGSAFNNHKWEADHIVVCKRRDFPEKYILCAVDKDVLYTLPGMHFNYYSSTKYNIPMKWVTVTEEESVKRYYIQTLTGDTGDGVIGLSGIGPKKAEKALKGCTTEAEMWEAVVDMYEKHNRDVIDAVTNFRLVDMRQLKLNENGEYEVCLWKPVK